MGGGSSGPALTIKFHMLACEATQLGGAGPPAEVQNDESARQYKP
jgi:hypothetical protein